MGIDESGVGCWCLSFKGRKGANCKHWILGLTQIEVGGLKKLFYTILQDF